MREELPTICGDRHTATVTQTPGGWAVDLDCSPLLPSSQGSLGQAVSTQRETENGSEEEEEEGQKRQTAELSCQ